MCYFQVLQKNRSNGRNNLMKEKYGTLFFGKNRLYDNGDDKYFGSDKIHHSHAQLPKADVKNIEAVIFPHQSTHLRLPVPITLHMNPREHQGVSGMVHILASQLLLTITVTFLHVTG